MFVHSHLAIYETSAVCWSSYSADEI